MTTASHAIVNGSSLIGCPGKCGSAPAMKKICTRIGVFRITSTYVAASQLTTGTRCERAAPSTMPMASEPAMPIAATFSVCLSPSQKSGRWSQMNCQSKLAASIREEGGAAARTRPLRSGGYGQIAVTSFPTG